MPLWLTRKPIILKLKIYKRPYRRSWKAYSTKCDTLESTDIMVKVLKSAKLPDPLLLFNRIDPTFENWRI
jgi:hypothetical protein